MKRKLSLALVFLLIAVALVSCNTNNRTNLTENQNTAQQNLKSIRPVENGNWYRIDAELNAKDKTITAKQDFTYRNNENVTLKELYFHVYANAFKNKETAPFLFDDFNRAYDRGFKPGYTEVSSLKTKEGKSLKYSFQGEGNSIMKVELPKPLKPKEAIELDISFTVVIPPANERFGWGDNNFNLGNWYPIAAVYDKDGWNLDKYYAIGDPFYSDSSNYIVKIKAPKEYTIAASGNLVKEKEENNSKIWEFQGYNMRDFAFIANNKFLVKEQIVDGTIVKSYYYKDDKNKGEKALEIGVDSIKVFNNKFGEYPYPSYSVVETIFPSGMEYPGLIYVSDNYYNKYSADDMLSTVIAHETAHQWWYSLVGNDQIDEAWLDEGFATYSESIYIENSVNKEKGKEYFDARVQNRHDEVMAEKIIDGVVVKSLSEFSDWNDYGPTAYTRGAVVLNELRNKLGDKTFFKVIKEYFKEYEFKIATTDDFIKTCEKVSGQELDNFFNTWLYAKL